MYISARSRKNIIANHKVTLTGEFVVLKKETVWYICMKIRIPYTTLKDSHKKPNSRKGLYSQELSYERGRKHFTAV